MKKILTIFDGSHLSEAVFDFINQTQSNDKVLLTAVFLQSIDYAMVWNYPLFLSGFSPTFIAEETLTAKNIERFKSLCEKNNIEYRVHGNFGKGALELIRTETRFSDLLIMAGDFFYNETYYIDPESYTRDALHEAECPVLLLPHAFRLPRKNILSYDGSASSMFAIKQFTLLFPEWRKNETHVVYAHAGDKEIPDLAYIEEYAGRIFENPSLDRLQLDPKKYFATWTADEKNAILVTGAYDRSSLSETLRKSFAEEVVRENKLPIFIAHK